MRPALFAQIRNKITKQRQEIRAYDQNSLKAGLHATICRPDLA